MTQPPPPPGYEEPGAPKGYEEVGDGKPKELGFLDALAAFFGGDKEGGGAKTFATAPVTAAKGVYQAGQDVEKEQGIAVGDLLATIMGLGKVAQEGRQQQRADIDALAASESLPLKGAGKALQVATHPMLRPLAQATSLETMLPMILKAIDVAGAGATAAGADFTPTQSMAMSRALKQGDMERLMAELGSTTAMGASLGLTGKPGAMGRALGMGAGPKVAPAASQALPTNLDTSAIKSPVLSRNVFAGGPPARSMPVPELQFPQTLGQESGSAAAQTIEQQLAGTITGKGAFKDLMARQDAAVSEYGKTVGQFISKDINTAKGSRASVSRIVQERLAEAKGVLSDNASQLFEQVWDNPALKTGKGELRKISISGTPLEEVAKKLAPDAAAITERLGADSSLNNVLQSLLDPKKKWMTVRELQAIKQASFNNAETAKLGMSGGASKLLAKAADETMEQHLRLAGGDGLVARWQVAKRRYEELMKVQDDSLVKGILKADKDNAYALVKSASAEDTDTIWKMLKPVDRQLVKARLVQDAIEASTSKSSTLKETLIKAMGGEVPAQPAGTSPANAARFNAEMRKFHDEKLVRLFTADERKAIATLSEAMEKAGGLRNSRSLVLNGMMYYGAVRGLSGDMTALGSAAGLAVGTKLLAKGMTNPRTAETIAKYLSAAAKAGEAPFTNAAVSYWGQQMAKQLSELRESDSNR